MNNSIRIDGHLLQKTRIGISEYTVSSFSSEIFEFQFNVSLQPTGDTEILPTYQLKDRTKLIPRWVEERMDEISDWIIKNED